MKAVDIAVRTTEDKVQVDVELTVERRKPSDPDVWEPVEGKSVNYWTGTADANRRTILLEDDERLIVSGKSDVQLVYDRRAKAVVVKKVGEMTTAETAREEAKQQMQRLREEQAANDAAFKERWGQLKEAYQKLEKQS